MTGSTYILNSLRHKVGSFGSEQRMIYLGQSVCVRKYSYYMLCLFGLPVVVYTSLWLSLPTEYTWLKFFSPKIQNGISSTDSIKSKLWVHYKSLSRFFATVSHANPCRPLHCSAIIFTCCGRHQQQCYVHYWIYIHEVYMSHFAVSMAIFGYFLPTLTVNVWRLTKFWIPVAELKMNERLIWTMTWSRSTPSQNTENTHGDEFCSFKLYF